jgi:CheY-like chemotaxis protein
MNSAPEHTEGPCPSGGRKPGILVVDDEIAVRTLLEAAFRSQGYTVWLAADGQQAVDLYQEHRPEIALVFLDVRMPILDGPQALQALRRLEPAVRCCFMSGQSGQYSDDELMELGAVHVFKKPFRLGELLQIVESLTADFPAPA